MNDEHKKELTKILGIGMGLTRNGDASWAEIYREIGRLQERAARKDVGPFNPMRPSETQDFQKLAVHYHNGTPCYNNPCVWC